MAAMSPRRAAGQLLLRGVLFTLRRKCGKPGCHCATGQAHESPALAYPVAGRTKTMTLHEQEIAEVAAALSRYGAAREELDQAAEAGIAVLAARRAARRGGRQR